VPPLARTQPLPDAVYASLSGQILDGSLAPGEALPSERLLSEEYEVNRHAIREAMKRLQQAGLVRVSHGGATRVLDWRATGGLDLLAQVGRAGRLGPELVRSGLEMRLCIGADAARRCSLRAPAPLVAEMRDLVAAPPANEGQAADAYERLWALIVEGADNLAYRLALNSLIADSGAFDLRTLSLPEALDHEALTTLVDAVAGGEPDAAESAARDLLERTLGDAPWSS
jgi:DNA-binding FadR family transcriptional regulator